MAKTSSRGIDNIRTAQKTRLRSKPKLPGSEYLELYLLEKNRDRYERERETSGQLVKELEEDVKKLVRELPMMNSPDEAARPAPSAPRKKMPQSVKKMDLTY